MTNFLSEIGLTTLYRCSGDVHIIILVRMLRLMAFGITTLILVVFLKETGMSDVNIGYFMTLTFLGDLVSSFVFSVLADGFGRRITLVFSCVLMALTGISFAVFNDPVILTAVAILGVLTPGGGEVGPFRSIEQSSLALLAPHEARSDVYAWYTFSGYFCLALGSFVCGAALDWLTVQGYTPLQSYKLVFWVYGLVAAVLGVLCLFLTKNMELEPKPAAAEPETTVESAQTTEQTQLIPGQKKKRRFVPELSSDVLAIVIKLSILFGLDAFALSLVQGTWLTYYIKHKFDVSSTTLGLIFFLSNNIAGFASLFSTTLTKRYGPVVTMVATHLPASSLLILLPLPASLVATLAILFVRASMQLMDVAPKHVFLATLVPPEHRTSVFAWTNIVKTTGLTFGPSITGYLTGLGVQWVAFVVGGSLKVTYDLGILGTFLAYNRHQEH